MKKQKKKWKDWLNKDCRDGECCKTYSYPADNFTIHYYCGLHPNTYNVRERKYKACRDFVPKENI